MSKVYVIGGANVDISARSFNQIVDYDSNPGKVSYSFGGVAHNIARNLSNIGCKVDYITAFSNDHFGRQLVESMRNSNISIDHSQFFDDQTTSLYLAVVEPDGDMKVAIADMEILSHLDISKLEPILKSLSDDDILVLDTNLTVEQIGKLINMAACQIFVDPISTAKAVKISGYLDKVDMLKPNRLEAEILSGLKLEDKDDYLPVLNWFIEKGCGSIVISMGKDGLIGSNGHEAYHLSNTRVEIVNTTGAGDAFMAGYVYRQHHGLSFLESLKYALANSAIALISLDTVNSKNSEEMLKKYYEKVEKESQITVLK
ncbi:MAG: carbohydrate kinase family protein [Erysipelotrichaceae bacterium]|nr:carbohydrate kinase family protein [Erysipelotrichaceae bacterium]